MSWRKFQPYGSKAYSALALALALVHNWLFIVYFHYFQSLSVRVVQSSRAGMGKSLVVKHLAEQLTNLPNNKKLRKDLVLSLCPTIPVHGISVDSDCVTRTLRSHAVKRDIPVSRIFHLDMSQSVSSTHCNRIKNRNFVTIFLDWEMVYNYDVTIIPILWWPFFGQVAILHILI